ncbi:Membrane protein [Sulfurimonas denitrificans DSM 1251]|uniref:Membrane protein n=1 Tax=Sulfurimonas denitrificans (strain ATCC 33889 / DSM 1251) TaxID=326298 RepID=Q30PH3_SULDN|nr:outer membrane protein transport protein [Sulfurimonas denitrificans]ABB45108.1 Membrane protein [Sulfurimonas denitrificans DSM 1251]
MRNAFVFLLLGSALVAGGYKIPETSLNSVALGAANVAHANGADAAYYNPANMAFMKDEAVIEGNLIYIGLSDVNFQGSYTSSLGTTSGYNIDSKRENFIIPSLHYVSQDISGVRLGVSLVSPAGLSKRWQDAPAVYSSEEFTLKTVELNPSVAFKVSENIGVALGLRAIYTDGIVKSTSPIASRDMSGDSIDFGYNLALSYKPTSELEFALTYRSKVDLTSKGSATLFYRDIANSFGGGVGATYSSSSSASVSVPVPALLNIAAAYTFLSKTTLEFVYERNYWSAYKELDFNYGSGVNPVTNIVFGTSIAKNFKDCDVFRFGVTQELNALKLMGGLVIDKSPVPNSTISFELPDSDSLSFSMGARYQINDKLNIGLAALYSVRENRRVSNASIDGEFSDANVLIVSSAIEYKF